MTEEATGLGIDAAAAGGPWYLRHRLRALLLIFVVWALFCSTVFLAVAGYLIQRTRQSEPFALALERVRADTEMREALGTPIEAGWLTLGSVDEDRGYAEFTMRVSGPLAKAGLRVVAERPPPDPGGGAGSGGVGSGGGGWEIVFLDAGVRNEYGGRVITLVNDKPPTGRALPEPTEEAKRKYGVEDE